MAADAHVAGLMTGKAGLLHLHLGDGDRGLEMIRQGLDGSEIPARVFHPTHVNRSPDLFQEALEIASRGCSIDVTAFPEEEEGGNGLSAIDAITAFLESELPPERLTVSSDAGGSLPVFDDAGRVATMDVGQPGSLIETIRELLTMGHSLERVLPPFTSNVAGLFRLPGKGRIEVGADADLAVLDVDGFVTDVMAMGRWHVRHGQVAIQGAFE